MNKITADHLTRRACVYIRQCVVKTASGSGVDELFADHNRSDVLQSVRLR